MGLFTRGKVWISEDRSTYIEYDKGAGTVSIVVEGTTVWSGTSSTATLAALAVTGATALNGDVAIGNAVGDAVGFYGTTAITQRASSAQASTLGSTTASIGTAAAALLQEIANTLTALGLWKGSA